MYRVVATSCVLLRSCDTATAIWLVWGSGWYGHERERSCQSGEQVRCTLYLSVQRLSVILVFYAVVAGQAAQAQGYIPLLDSTAHWFDSFWAGDPGPGTSISECNKYFILGDTLAHDTEYYFLRRSSTYSFEMNEPPYISDSAIYTSQLVGLIREDTTNRKVYFRPSGWPAEMLLYDFAAEVGPYPWTYLFETDELSVTAIDTVLIGNSPHRRLVIDEYVHLIEGIGDDMGFMPPGIFGPYMAGGLSCHTVAAVPDYRNEQWWNTGCICDAPAGVHAADNVGIHVWPNPTAGNCHVEGANVGSAYFLFTLDGRLLVFGRCSHLGTAAISMDNLAAGIYLLKLKDGEREQCFRIVRE